jgi:small subunit ribosomal protein S20
LATRSAAKAHRQSLKRRLRHRSARSAAKTAVKKADTAVVASDIDLAQQRVRQAISLLDRAAKKGSFHANNAGRRKSRLARRLNAALAAVQPVAPQPAVSEEKPRRKAAVRRTKAKG